MLQKIHACLKKNFYTIQSHEYFTECYKYGYFAFWLHSILYFWLFSILRLVHIFGYSVLWVFCGGKEDTWLLQIPTSPPLVFLILGGISHWASTELPTNRDGISCKSELTNLQIGRLRFHREDLCSFLSSDYIQTSIAQSTRGLQKLWKCGSEGREKHFSGWVEKT